jgi:hypothetical protein
MADYTHKEILEFHFKRFDEKLDDIKATLKAQNVADEKRFEKIEIDIQDVRHDVADLQNFRTRAMVLWGVGIAVVTFAINKLW